MPILVVPPNHEPPEPRFPALFLENPKFSGNVINAHRLAACFGLPQVWCTGSRVGPEVDRGRKTRIPREERLRGFGHVDLIWCESGLDALRAAEPLVVGVEIAGRSIALTECPHDAPDHGGRIVYAFGPEDGTLSPAIQERCDALVQIPAFHSMNLAAAVAAVLWDRTSRMHRDHGVPLPALREEQRP